MHIIKHIFHCLGFFISSFDEAHIIAQTCFLRKGERWDVQSRDLLHQNMRSSQQIIMSALQSLHMIDAVLPTQTQYNYALIMGSLRQDVERIFAFLSTMVAQECAFDHYVLLGSCRVLHDEEKKGLPESVQTESQMMVFLWDRYFKELLEKTVVINAPLVQKDDGSYARPTTDDTLTCFAKEYAGQRGSCLVVAENPFMMRQTMVAQRILMPYGFTIEGAATQVEAENNDIIMIMDEFARFLYEINLSSHDDIKATFRF